MTQEHLYHTLTRYFDLKRDIRYAEEVNPGPRMPFIERELGEKGDSTLIGFVREASSLRERMQDYQRNLKQEFVGVQATLRDTYNISRIVDPEKPMLFDMDGPAPGTVRIEAARYWFRWSEDLAQTVCEKYAEHQEKYSGN